MALRHFLYLNTDILNEYISAIDGYTYEDAVQSFEKVNGKEISGKAGISILSGKAGHADKSTEGGSRKIVFSEAAKFDRVYKYLNRENADEEPLRYYEFLSDEIFTQLRRDAFIEVLVTARFSKMKALADSARKIGELAQIFESFTDSNLLDKKAESAINGLTALTDLKSKNEIACVFEFEDGKYPLVAYLNEKYFKCEEENFVGQAYLLCKVLRKIPQGSCVKLDELLDDVKKLKLNREQRRKMPKKIDNPEIISDVVKGPALIVTPIAVYQ